MDREYVVVQSEYYLKKGAGDLYQHYFEAAQNRNPLYVGFIGHQTVLHDQLTTNLQIKCWKKPVSTHRPEGITLWDLTVLDFDADIPTAVGTEKHRTCCVSS